MAVWYPDAVVNEAVKNGGSFIDGVPFRGVLHTTEGPSFHPRDDSYGGWHTAYPHFTLIEKSSGVTVYQHLPINIAARALKNKRGGVQTNRARAIQIEIVGRAAASPNFSEQMLGAISAWMRWVENETGVAPVAPLEFIGWGGSGEGAPSRMSSNEWMQFDGWCGHQHVPENDHWDPGRINIDRLLAAAPAEDAAAVAAADAAAEGVTDAEKPTTSGGSYKVVNVGEGDILNVRAGAGLDGEIVSALAADAAGLGISGESATVGQSKWVQVTVAGNTEGWVNAHYLAPDDRRPLYRTDVEEGSYLNVRTEAGSEQDVVATLTATQRDIETSGRAAVMEDGVWWEIAAPAAGWVHSDYLVDQDARPTLRGGADDVPEIDEITHGDVEIDSVYDEVS
jgi:hypothetical protein